MEDECEQLGRWFKGCRFEPRYDQTPDNGAGFAEVSRLSGDRMVELFTRKTYVRDVCVTCGKTIERA